MTPYGNSKTVWRYTWNVGNMPTSGQTTITVSGTDMSGNAYVPGNQFISFSTRPLPNYLPSGQLLAWYPFNSDASDESGNGKNGVVKNGSSSSNPPQLPTDRFVKSIEKFISIYDKDNFSNFKIFDFRINGQLILE